MTKIFVSYSRKDLRFVRKLVADLEEAGLDVWRDLDDLEPGTRFISDIEKALRECQYVIVVLSPDSVASEWVEREYMFADNLENTTIVPILRRPCKLPLFFHNRNYIDVQGRKYGQNFGEILGLFSEGNAPPSPPAKDFPWKVFAGTLLTLVIVVLVFKYILPHQTGSASGPSGAADEETGAEKPNPVPYTPKPIENKEPSDEMVPPIPTDPPLPQPQDDMWISYDSDVNGNFDLFILNPGTGEKEEIITDPSHDKVGSWSPDGGILAFESNRGSTFYYQIYLFYNQQQKIVKLTDDGDCSNWHPAWSPDGSKITFYSNCENDRRDIYIMDRDGSNRIKLTEDDGENMFPAFSPDGNSITFTSTRSGDNQIFIMNVDGSDQRLIANGCVSNFSPDGNWLWFSARCEDSDIKRVRIDGTDLSTVGTLLGHNPSLSPDGQFLVFQSDDEIWIMNVDGSIPTLLISGAEKGHAPSFKP